VSYERGIDNLVLMRGGYESAYWQLTRRDGSTKPTADWDFDGKNLTNVGRFEAASANIAGDLSVGGSQTVSGAGTFSGLLSALGGLLVKGATELQGTLTVAGAAIFQDDVTVNKDLAVKGDVNIDGDLKATHASFTGVLTAQSLVIVSTQIGSDGTLLGAASGWGVTSGTSCQSNLALAQSKDGKLQICQSGTWVALINNENVVSTAPGLGQSCSPEGAPGRLPDGTLAVCRNGQWEAGTHGTATEGAACSVEGAVASKNENVGLHLLGCKGGVWTSKVFTLPKLTYGTAGRFCAVQDELALEERGYPSLLICKDGSWQPPGTQLLVNKGLGGSCTVDGVLAADMNTTGLLVCKNSVWSKVTEPVGLGSACNEDGRAVKIANGPPKLGSTLYCVSGRWTVYPSTLKLVRGDGVTVELIRQVDKDGVFYFIYSEPGWPRGKAQTLGAVGIGLWSTLLPNGANPGTVAKDITSNNRCTGWSLETYWKDAEYDDEDNKGVYEVCLATDRELYEIKWRYNGRPSAWNFEFDGGPEVWTARRLDECSNQVWGCDIGWQNWGDPASWWDHVAVDIWNNNTFKRWNTDARPVIFRIKKTHYWAKYRGYAKLPD
jgi:hypothetical protein